MLKKLAKDVQSGGGGCPAVYLDDETWQFVVQAPEIDPATWEHCENRLPGETAVRINTQVILDAVQRYQAGELG